MTPIISTITNKHFGTFHVIKEENGSLYFLAKEVGGLLTKDSKANLYDIFSKVPQEYTKTATYTIDGKQDSFFVLQVQGVFYWVQSVHNLVIDKFGQWIAQSVIPTMYKVQPSKPEQNRVASPDGLPKELDNITEVGTYQVSQDGQVKKVSATVEPNYGENNEFESIMQDVQATPVIEKQQAEVEPESKQSVSQQVKVDEKQIIPPETPVTEQKSTENTQPPVEEQQYITMPLSEQLLAVRVLLETAGLTRDQQVKALDMYIQNNYGFSLLERLNQSTAE